MSKFSGLLAKAVSDTLSMSRAPIEDWLKEGRPFAPGIPAGDGSGSYRTSRAAMDALARIGDGLLENDPELARRVSQDAARMAASLTLGELLPPFLPFPSICGCELRLFKELHAK